MLSRIINLRVLTLVGIVKEMNATLQRKEQARIYHYYGATGRYPPRRDGAAQAGERAEPVATTARPRDRLGTQHLQ